jgi:hypothetical protein
MWKMNGGKGWIRIGRIFLMKVRLCGDIISGN